MFYRLRILSLKTRILYTIVLEKFKPIFKAWSSKGKEGNNWWWWNCFHPKRVDGVYFQRERFVLLERQLYSLNFCAALLRFLERNFFFFFFFNCVGWNHVGILSRLACFARWNLCGLFSLSFSSSFFLFFSAESSASKKISSFRSRCSHEPTFHFSRVFRERNFRVTLTIFQHP